MQIISSTILQRPELSYKIQKDHFETLFPGQEGDYELNDDFYERSIPEADLTLAWDDDNDGQLIENGSWSFKDLYITEII